MWDMLYWTGWAQASLVALIVAVAAFLFDRRRQNRREVDAVGFMPWTAISVLALMLALFTGAVAFNG